MAAQANHRTSPRRRWLQFRLRSLLVLPLLFALAYAWTDQVYDHFLVLMTAYGAIVGSLWAVGRMKIIGLSHSGLRRLLPVVGAAVGGGMTIGLLAGPVMLWIALSHVGYLRSPVLVYRGLSRSDALELITSGVAGSWLGAIFGMMGAVVVGLPLAYLLFLARYRAAQKGQPEAVAQFGRSDWERPLGRLPRVLWAAFCSLLLGVPTLWLGCQVYRDRVERQAAARLADKGRVIWSRDAAYVRRWMARTLGDSGLEIGRRPVYLGVNAALDEEEWLCVRQMRSLQDLQLYCSRMTDRQLAVAAAALRPLSGTRCRLHLRGAQVTDAGVKHLEGIQCLVELDLSETRVTPDGVRRLQQALPGAQIYANRRVQGDFGPGAK